MRSAAAAAADGGRASNTPLLDILAPLALQGTLRELRMWLKACIAGCSGGKLSDAASVVKRTPQGSAPCQTTNSLYVSHTEKAKLALDWLFDIVNCSAQHSVQVVLQCSN